MTQGLKVYQTPGIEMIHLDNEISLVLASDPPIGQVKLKTMWRRIILIMIRIEINVKPL